MTFNISRNVVIAAALLALAGSTPAIADQESPQHSNLEGREWTPHDSLKVRYYSPPGEPDGPPDIVQSPDKRFFAVRSWNDEISDNTLVRTIDVYQVDVVKSWLAGRDKRPAPVFTLSRKLADRKSGATIDDLAWDDDSASLLFTGSDNNNAEQCYRVRVPSGEVEALTTDSFTPKSRVAVKKGSILYQVLVFELEPAKLPYPLLVPTRDGEGRFKFSDDKKTKLKFFAKEAGSDAWSILLEGDGMRGWFSPDGKQAVVCTTNLITEAVSGKHRTRRRYAGIYLIDFEHRNSRRITDPWDEFTNQSKPGLDVLWSADSKTAVLVNVKPPPGLDRQTPSSGGLIMAYNVVTARWQEIQSVRKVAKVDLLGEGDKLLVSHIDDTPPAVWEMTNDRWSELLAQADGLKSNAKRLQAQEESMFRVWIQQSPNDPPQLMASDGLHEKILSLPDPALEGIYRSPVQKYEWITPDGSKKKGYLSLPRGVPRPMPLVIQLTLGNAENPDAFLPDGTHTSGFARQALNATGMAVLSLDVHDIRRTPKDRTPAELEAVLQRIDAAVEGLAEQGLVDTQRVGLVGFSRTGYYALHALTHPKRTPFAAAAIFDAMTNSYLEYLWETPDEGEIVAEKMNGGNFLSNKASWLAQDPLFNLDRMTGAALFVEHNVSGSGRRFSDFDPFQMFKLEALQNSRRPFDMLWITEGSHPANLPLQRLAEMEATVDWMRFWLKGDEGSAPAKEELFHRWRQIKERWQAQQAWEAAGNPIASRPTVAFKASL